MRLRSSWSLDPMPPAKRKCRLLASRYATPTPWKSSVSQAVAPAAAGGERLRGKRGIDGGKKVKGIKINILVDKHGFPLAVALSTANVHDCVGIIPALKEVSTSGFRGKLLGDTAYQGENLKTTGQDLGIEVETKVCGAKGKFVPTEIRWVVERSFAWLSRYRRLNTIFDRTDASLIAFVLIAFISILSCRLRRLETAENMA